MISIKGGTKVFSENPNSAKLPGDNFETLSSEEKKKLLGGLEVGDYLNKVSDPNWVDPSKSRNVVGNNKMDKDAFFKLLLTQMKNQDPTNPLKSHEMAAQLAQFSSLEQLSNINRSIETLTKAQMPSANFDALKMIGKTVSGDSAKLVRTNHDDTHDIQFDLMADAKDVTVNIKDQAGQTLRTLNFFDLKKGKNEIHWDGVLEDSSQLRPGSYTAEFVANSSNGKKLSVNTKFEGKITGVNFTAQGPVMLIGKQAIRMTDIKEITDPQVQADPVNQNVNKLEMKSSNAKVTVKPEDGKPTAPLEGDLSDIAMSRGMTDKIKQAGVKTDAL